MRHVSKPSSILWYSLASAIAAPYLAAGAQQDELCTTSACVKAAANLLNNLDEDYQNIDPCNDFEQYACGGFATNNPSSPLTATLDNIQSTNEYILQTILESSYPGSNTSNSKDDRTAFDMVVRNYQSCMNVSANDTSALSGVAEMVDQISKRFPVDLTSDGLNATLSNQDQDALADTLAYLTSVGVPIFGRFWTSPDPQVPVSGDKVLHAQGDTNLTKESMIPSFGYNFYNTSDWALPAQVVISELIYVPLQNMTETLQLLVGDKLSNASASALAGRILEFAGKVAQAELIAFADPSSALELYYTTTVVEAAKQAPALVLDKVIQKLAPPSYKVDRMVFQYPKAYGNLSEVVAATPKSTLQALMMVMAYYSYAQFLPVPVTTADRWTICYPYVDTSLPWIASKFFNDEQYGDDVRQEFKTMAEELKSAFYNRVVQADWVGNDTKKLVLEKVSKIKLLIGYPDENPDASNATNLLQYYSSVNITNSFFDNALSIRKWDATRVFRSLLFPVDTSKWLEFGVHSYVANARYYANFNNIHMGAGISQVPLYFKGAPSYLTYGSVGMITGHEMTHGFDTNGRQWNQNTQYRDWWDEQSVANFNNRTACMVKQFSAIPAIDSRHKPVLNATSGEPVYVSGIQTLSENIADAGGLANAWDAWRKHEARTPGQKLPGLEGFNKEQLFFISAGQSWCSKLNAKAILNTVATDIHAPPFARAMNVQLNSQGFRETFKCKNKKPECPIW